MTQAQQWLDSKYNNKQSGDNIKLLTSEELSGEIIIKDYTNTKEINLVRLENGSLSKGKIVKVTINNCPALERVILGENEITEIVFEGDFPNLTQLEAQSNQLKEIELSKFPDLEILNIARNPISSQTLEKVIKDLTKLKFINTPGFNLKNIADDHTGWINSNDIKNVLGVNPSDPLPDDWKNKLDDLKKRPTQEDLNNAKDEFKDYINPNNLNDPTNKAKLEQAAKNAGFISPNDLENEAKKKGMVSKGEYDKVVGERNARPNITLVEHERLKNNQNELERWRKLGKNPETVAQDIKDLQSKPATGTAVLTPDQQQKLNNYDKLEKQEKWLMRYIEKDYSKKQYAEILQELNKVT